MNTVNKEDIIGLWSEVTINHDSLEDNELAFYANGTGFLSWARSDEEIMDKFVWSIDENGLLNIEDSNKYTFEEMKLKKIEKSDINLKGISVRFFKGKRIDGQEVDAIEFSEPICEYSRNSFGLICRDIDIFDYYTELDKIIEEAESKAKNI